MIGTTGFVVEIVVRKFIVAVILPCFFVGIGAKPTNRAVGAAGNFRHTHAATVILE